MSTSLHDQTSEQQQRRLQDQPTGELSSARRVTVFQVRDWLEKNLPETVVTKAIAVLDVLILHTLFKGDDYGQVTRKHCGREYLMWRTGLGKTAVSEALTILGPNGCGFITKDRRGRKDHKDDVIHTLPLLELVASDLPMSATRTSSDVRQTDVPARARSSSSNKETYLTTSSSLRDFDDDQMEIREIVQEQDLGEGASARVGEGAGRDGSPSARETTASAAPPGDGAPAAPRPASRENRGQSDEAMRLALKLEKDTDGVIIAWMLVGELRRLSQEHGFAVVDEAITWALKYADAKYIPGNSAGDKGAVFNSSLKRIAPDYIAAREQVAEELGEDLATFDFIAQLERVEREAKEREELRVAQLGEAEPVIREMATLRGIDYDEFVEQTSKDADIVHGGDLSKVLDMYRERLAKERERKAKNQASREAYHRNLQEEQERYKEALRAYASAIVQRDGLDEEDARDQAVAEVRKIGGWGNKTHHLERLVEEYESMASA